MILRFLIVMLVLVSCMPAYSFNGRKCDNLMRRKGGFRILTFLTTSSAQFSTSTGECSMLGKTDHDAKVFIAHNKDKLLQDFAKGEGEYARSLAELYGCDLASQRLFSRQGKKRFFEVNQAKSDEELHLILKEEIKQIYEINGSCQLSNSLS